MTFGYNYLIYALANIKNCSFRAHSSGEALEEHEASAYIKSFQNILNLDVIQIKSKLDLFSVQFSEDDSPEKLRNLLKKSLLEEILKAEIEDRQFYEVCLNETIVSLAFAASGRKPEYSCCLIGCKFQTERHRDYIIHIRRHHPNIKKITCNFRKQCLRIFTGMDQLVAHLRRDHSNRIDQNVPVNVAGSEINIPCKCNRLACGGINFPNLKQLMTHYNSFHGNEERDCIFIDCQSAFHASTPQSAINHFRIKHKATGKLKLKARHLLAQDTEISIENLPQDDIVSDEDSEINVGFVDEVYEEAELDSIDNIDEHEGSDNEEESEEFYLQYYSDFLNRLAHFKFIPQSTIQEISEEYILNTKRSLARREKALRKSLKKIKDLSQTEVEKIVKEVIENDAFLNAQLKLNTEYKRSKYIQENPNYVGPIEVLLNKAEVQQGVRKDVFHYVPVIDSFKTLIQDPSFNKMVAMKRTVNDDKIRDIKDGSVFKTNEYFQSNPEAYAAIVYSDGVEMKNPLGAARGTYKIVQVFYTICEIEKPQRSRIDRLQLLMVFREKLLKKYSLKTIYRMFINDLKKLEDGVVIQFPMTRRVKLGIACYSADNLEASIVGGFSACFSSKDVCRVCHIEHKDLDTCIHDLPGKVYSLWSEEEYDRIIQTSIQDDMDEDDNDETVEIDSENLFTEFITETDEEDDSDVEGNDSSGDDDGAGQVGRNTAAVNTRGLKAECPLNVLSSFHCTKGFPQDILHDVFEGVIPEDLLGIIRILAHNGQFSIADYNCALVRLGFSSYETADKPLPVPASSTVKKLRGKGRFQQQKVQVRHFFF